MNQLLREDIIKEMRESIGTKDPIVFFAKMIDAFSLLFDHIDILENKLNILKKHSALSIQWEPKVASDLISEQISLLRMHQKGDYLNEISALKVAYAEDEVTQNYSDFVTFWTDVLGWHPFLEY